MEKNKNSAAVALGSLGGKKTAQNMTAKQRKERAKKAVARREELRALRAKEETK